MIYILYTSRLNRSYLIGSRKRFIDLQIDRHSLGGAWDADLSHVSGISSSIAIFLLLLQKRAGR